MKNKILGICLCAIIVAITILPATGKINEKNIISSRLMEPVPIIDFMNPPLINLDNISLVIENIGNGTAEDVSWQMEVIEGEGLLQGKLFNPKEISGIAPSLGSGEYFQTKIDLWGIGLTTIKFNVTYRIADMQGCDVVFTVKDVFRDLGLTKIHLFPQFLQPEKEWTLIEDFEYFNETDSEGVQFNVEGIRQYHNVRVVLGAGYRSDDVVFLATCKFDNGTAYLEECGLTKDLVLSGEAHWELELVDNK